MITTYLGSLPITTRTGKCLRAFAKHARARTTLEKESAALSHNSHSLIQFIFEKAIHTKSYALRVMQGAKKNQQGNVLLENPVLSVH